MAGEFYSFLNVLKWKAMDLGFLFISMLAILFLAGIGLHAYLARQESRESESKLPFARVRIKEVRFQLVRAADMLPPAFNTENLAQFFRQILRHYEGTPEDIERGIRDVLAPEGREGGFVLIAELEGKIVGALVMQRTGIKGYVPENPLQTNRVFRNLKALQANLKTIGNWMQSHGASWTVVTKVLCGHLDKLRALQIMGVRSLGDSLIENLRSIERTKTDFYPR